MIQNAQQPLDYLGGGIINLNLETFYKGELSNSERHPNNPWRNQLISMNIFFHRFSIQILNNVMSFYMMLRTITGN